jgi:hypothetical protein
MNALAWFFIYFLIGSAVMVGHDYYYEEFRKVSWTLTILWPLYALVWIITGIGIGVLSIVYGILFIIVKLKRRKYEQS